MPITISEIINNVELMCHIIIKNEVYFCELDSAAGDGDFGMSLAKGFKEVLNYLPSANTEDIGAFIGDCAMIIYENCGGASGPIWGSGFKAAARTLAGKSELSDNEVVEMFERAIAGVQKMGGAQLGDKTLLDALIPAVASLRENVVNGVSLNESFKEAANAAKEGAEVTKSLVAKKGRATYLAERSLSYPDAGAMAIAVIMSEMIENGSA